LVAVMAVGLERALRPTQRKSCRPLPRVRDLLAVVGEGVMEASTPSIHRSHRNWRRWFGAREDYLLTKLRFMVVNPLRRVGGLRRFRALGLTAPFRQAA